MSIGATKVVRSRQGFADNMETWRMTFVNSLPRQPTQKPENRERQVIDVGVGGSPDAH
jgi:hypothetical protein